MDITVYEQDIIKAANEGMDSFVQLFADSIMQGIGGVLTADSMSMLNSDQITLLAYIMFRDEVMDGGFVQLIHNGYGPFIFENPFAKAMNLWGAREFRNLVYDARPLYMKYRDELVRDMSDDDFMALFEQYPEFDDLDDAFVEMEESVTGIVATYIDNNIDRFAHVIK